MKKLETAIIVPLSDVIPDENQPRKLFEPSRLKSLKDSVSKHGIISPLIVEKVGDKYLLEDGERRYRVAVELGLEEIPVIVEVTKSGVERIIRQYHVQEQHEGWTAIEKAGVVEKLSRELKLSVKQVCDLLAVSSSTVERYIAFASLIEKKYFQKNEIGIEWAYYLKRLKSFVKNIYEGTLEKEFDRNHHLMPVVLKYYDF